jgi:hypothetical protein
MLSENKMPQFKKPEGYKNINVSSPKIIKDLTKNK